MAIQNHIINAKDNTITTNAARAGKIGRMLIQQGKISTDDAEKVIRAQEKLGLQFGDAAVQLGLITQADVLPVSYTHLDVYKRQN